MVSFMFVTLVLAPAQPLNILLHWPFKSSLLYTLGSNCVSLMAHHCISFHLFGCYDCYCSYGGGMLGLLTEVNRVFPVLENSMVVLCPEMTTRVHYGVYCAK